VLALGLDRKGVAAEDVQTPFGEGLLEELAALRGRRDGVEDPGIREARLGVVGDELVAVRGDTNARKRGSDAMRTLPRFERIGYFEDTLAAKRRRLQGIPVDRYWTG
jgi:hypothetical protein